MRTNAPLAQRRGPGRWSRLLTSTALATAAAIAVSGGQLPSLATAPVASPDLSAYDLENAAQVREDQCRLGYVLRKGGATMTEVARTGLASSEAELHTAADPEYWNDTPLATAYKTDRDAALAKLDELNGRNSVWQTSLDVETPPPGYTYTGFRWPPADPDIFDQTGLSGWVADQFWQDEGDFYVDLHASASKESVDAVTKIATTRYSEDRYEDLADWQAWENMQFMHPMRADDARIFLQSGGFPTTAPDPDSMEFRVDVENLKGRFASCASTNPQDPHKVLTAEVVAASTEWQAELVGQKSQRDTILRAESKASSDLAVASQAMGEALGQSMIAGRLTDWQAYWLKQDPDTNLSYPEATEFAAVKTRIANAQARAAGRLFVASRAALAAKAQTDTVTAAQAEAYAIADTAGQPRGRGLMYAQQAAQVTKASAAAALAAAKATETASDATRASAADSKTLNALAETQSHATKAEFRRVAAQESAAQAKAAADGAAAQATEAAANASKAKAAQAKAEAAEKTAKDAATDAKAKRQTAEAERDNAKSQKEIAESERAKAASAEDRAVSQRQAAADALSAAQAAGRTASDKKDVALEAEQKATRARDNARTAEAERDAKSARASALEAHAAAVEGTSAAGEARTAANNARSAADDATNAAAAARSAANEATQAATNAREAATRAEAAAKRSQAAADDAQRDVAVTNAAVKKAHAAAADAINASEAAAQNVRTAKAQADTAKAEAAMAKADSFVARAEADAAAKSAVRTAGFAYATAQAALAARDSAAQVIQPANDAIELGSPYAETDASAGLAVLTGQAAKTAAEQQEAVAKAKASQAAKAATEAAALAAKASADAKAAADAAAQAADSAAKATASLNQARASAAEAAAAARAAKKSEANTVEYDQQATADAEAAQNAATSAGGYASDARSAATDAEQDAASARSAATAAEGDASTARDVADQADRDADTAEAAAARARQAARDAEDAADRAEKADEAESETVRMSDSGPAGTAGIVSFTDGVQDTITSDGDCTGTHTGDDIGCEITLHHHITGAIHYIALACPLRNVSATECIGFYTADYLGSKPIEYSFTTQKHINGWQLTEDMLKSFATAMVSDFIGCAHGDKSDCAWAAGTLLAPAAVKVLGRAIIGMRTALVTRSGLEAALAELRASGASSEFVAAAEQAVTDLKAGGSGANLTPLDEVLGGAVKQSTQVSCGPACAEMLSNGAVKEADLIKLYGNREISVDEMARALGTGWRGAALGGEELHTIQVLNSTGKWAAMVRSPGGLHFVVVDGAESSTSLLKILDPWDGSSYTVNMNEFAENWSLYAVFKP